MVTLPANKALTGLKMSVMGGSNPVPLYSLVSAASFLRPGTYEEAMRPNNQATIGFIDLSALSIWVREVFGDTELADAISKQVENGEPWGLAAEPVREMLMARVLQCREALGQQNEGSEG